MTQVARAAAVAMFGIEGAPVLVEAVVSQQLPGIAIIGLPDMALSEAKLRVRAAVKSSGLSLSDRFITINLSPAALPKHGSSFDLAIALAALGASGSLPKLAPVSILHVGELGLGGNLLRPAGLLGAVVTAKKYGFAAVMVPEACAAEARLITGIQVIAAEHLQGAVNWYTGDPAGWRNVMDGDGSRNVEEENTGALVQDRVAELNLAAMCVSDVIGQPEAVEALTIAAAGNHHISLVGPPGAGKTMLASRLPSILPDLCDEEAITATSIASLVSRTAISDLVRRPPFEAPHHTASAVSIIGGGQGGLVRPGAITRACHGVLFLDEAAEFPRTLLDALRQPLELGEIEIHRAGVHAKLPARLQLVLASNPCPCGYGGSAATELRCSCTPHQKRRYASKISGPLSDRIDLHLAVHRVSQIPLLDPATPRPTSGELRARVTAARAMTAARLDGTPWKTNSEIPGRALRELPFKLSSTATVAIDRALRTSQITVRGYDRVARIAWTIADLAGKSSPSRDDVARALSLRQKELQ